MTRRDLIGPAGFVAFIAGVGVLVYAVPLQKPHPRTPAAARAEMKIEHNIILPQAKRPTVESGVEIPRMRASAAANTGMLTVNGDYVNVSSSAFTSSAGTHALIVNSSDATPARDVISSPAPTKLARVRMDSRRVQTP